LRFGSTFACPQISADSATANSTAINQHENVKRHDPEKMVINGCCPSKDGMVKASATLLAP
jgi:hypothetical protein